MSSLKPRIGWRISIEPEVSTELAGTKIGDYYQNPDVTAQTQIISNRRMYELFGYGKPETDTLGVPSVAGTYITASLFGTKIIYPEDDMPQREEYALKDIKNVKKLKIPDIEKSEIYVKLFEKYEYLKKHYEPKGYKINKRGYGGNNSPLSTAVSMRGNELFSDMVTEPNAVKDLMSIITETEIKATKIDEKTSGTKVKGLYFEDDFGGLISPEMHAEFVLPYMKEKYKVFPTENRSLHTETYSRRHLVLLKELGITYYDAWPYRNSLTIKDILEELPGVTFTWNFETVKDFVQGTPEQIREKYKNMIKEGAKNIVADLCARKIKFENIKAFIEVAREFE